jgi:heptosyltransferase-1
LKILILKPSSLGDVVQALPVLRLIRRHLPTSEIHWWIDSNLRSLLEQDPDLAGIIPFERRRWASPIHWNELWTSLRAIRAMRFDWVIDLQALARSAVCAWLANGGFTIGLDDSREGARGFYDVVVPRRTRHTHAVDWYLETLRLLEVPADWNFVWLPERKEIAARIREKWPVNSSRWMIIAPGARWPNKRWPAESFAKLAARLAAEESDYRFAVLGSKEDAPLGEAIARQIPKSCLDLTGRTSLPEMVEWIRAGDLLVSNDTGPMHVAAALGKPVVALFGPTEPRRTGPYGQVDRVIQLSTLPCVPCMTESCRYEKPFECLRAVSPDVVLAEIRRRLHPPRP